MTLQLELLVTFSIKLSSLGLKKIYIYFSILVYPTPLDAFQPVAGSNVSRSRDVCDGAAAAAVGHVSSDVTDPLLSHVGNGQAVRSGQRCPAGTGRDQ